MTTETSTPYDRALAYTAERGEDDGAAAASWYFDGNTPIETYARVLQGCEDGDPAVLDTFPTADLGGQWADALTGPQLTEDAIVHADDWTMTRAEWVAYWAEHDAFADVCDAYETAYAERAAADIERIARMMSEPSAD